MTQDTLTFDLQSFKKAYDKNPQAFCIVYVSKENEKFKDITFVYANKAYEELSGFSLKRLIGHTYTEIIGEPSEQWNNIYGETAYSGKPQALTLPGPEIDGFVSVQCFQIALGFCGSNVLDVTSTFHAVEKAKEATRKSWEQIDLERKMYQELLDQSSAMITVIDADTYRIAYANAAARDITQKLGIEYVGSVCHQSITNSDTPCKDCVLSMENPSQETSRELHYANRIYRMVYKQIQWNGRKALMEYSEDITEQKLVIQMTEENLRLHENIISNLPTGIIVYKIENHTYKVVYANPAVCQMMGLKSGEPDGVIGEQIVSLVLPEYKDVVREAAYKMATTSQSVNYEFKSYIKDQNKIIWIEAEGRRAVQPDGNIFIYIGYKDITDSKEKALEFQRQVEFISNLSGMKVISKGHHNLTKNTVINLETLKEGGITADVNARYDDLIPLLQKTAINSNDCEKIGRLFNRQNLLTSFAEGKKEFSIDYRRVMKNDKRIWATVKCSIYEDPATHDVVAFQYSYDNTEQIQENQIVNRISTLEYGLLALIDVESHELKAFYRSYTTKEQLAAIQGDYDVLISKKILNHPVIGNKQKIVQELLIDNVLLELETRKIYSVDYSVKDANDKLRRMSFHYSYLDEVKDTVILFTADITESYQKEQAQIQNIEKAMQTIQETTRAKNDFFSRMSHDMRTPMNGILGLSALSEEETDVDILKNNMVKIRRSGEYLLSLINDTLDAQRIESGKLKLEPHIIEGTEIIETILDMVKTTAEAKKVDVRFDSGNTNLSGYVKTDSVRLKQIFVNLLSNAVKFTPEGGTVEFKVHCAARDYAVSKLVFTIEDTGIGMSKEFLETGIFQPFSQESNLVTAQYAGSGLGLSIAKSLVELMNGKIEVESELGVGTKFTIYLDLERVDEKIAKEHNLNRKNRRNNVSLSLCGKKILLAEDHPLNAEIAIKLLEKAGCHVVWLKNGQEVFDYFKTSEPDSFDAILMDIRMPILDGLKTAKAIRTLSRKDATEIPIIAMTANAYEEDIEKSLNAGMNAHIGKPIDPNVMYQVLSDCFNKYD